VFLPAFEGKFRGSFLPPGSANLFEKFRIFVSKDTKIKIYKENGLKYIW
jgi:hypothetical protein